MAKAKPADTHILEGLRHLAMDIDELVLDPANARKHTEKNLKTIESSLTRFGQRKPVVVQKTKGQLIVRAGNGTVEAARRLGWKTVAAIIVEENDVTATAYAIADNRSGELSSWDNDKLGASLKGLDAEYDLEGIGFSKSEMDKLLDRLDKKEEKPEIEFTEIIGESNNYVVLVFKNDIDWLQAQTVLGLKQVKSRKTDSTGKPWTVGTGRVLDGPSVLRQFVGE